MPSMPSMYTILATINALEGMGQPIPDMMHRGHIPGARNILCKDLYDEKTNCFYEAEHIKKGKACKVVRKYCTCWVQKKRGNIEKTIQCINAILYIVLWAMLV